MTDSSIGKSFDWGLYRSCRLEEIIWPRDPDLDKTVMQLIENYEVSEDDSDINDIETIIRDHEKESEQESEENSDVDSGKEEDDMVAIDNYFDEKRKNRFKWFKKTLVCSHYLTPQYNIIWKLPGIHPDFLRLSLIENEAWTYIFLTDMLLMIVKYINLKLAAIRQKYKEKSDLRIFDVGELRGFMDLQFYTATLKSNREDISSLFATYGTARDIF
ncbi:hypothetical protein NPIL_278281 [Nephila pilipes]|uniref:PiggyBac transposable element-derived protein domain-containing protein n=1 Tax=Nephila pilipes TaxID=299642 RepID=A0A8X6T6H2_NEPPI|nr:hypothetical protein NPIL_278281 [Nephila pilipes]